jgi:hypothetical protein
MQGKQIRTPNFMGNEQGVALGYLWPPRWAMAVNLAGNRLYFQ